MQTLCANQIVNRTWIKLLCILRKADANYVVLSLNCQNNTYVGRVAILY